MNDKNVKMTLEDIIEETKRFLSEDFKVDQDLILPESNLKETLDLDSLGYVALVVLIEENLGIKVTGEDFKEVATFGDFYSLVQKKLA